MYVWGGGREDQETRAEVFDIIIVDLLYQDIPALMELGGGGAWKYI